MAIYSKELCKKRIELWLKAEEAVATGQSYEIGSRKLTRADLGTIRETLEYWAGKLQEAESEEKARGRNRMYHFVPRDV